MNRFPLLCILLVLGFANVLSQPGGDPGTGGVLDQLGKNSAINYEVFRTDKIANQGDPGYSGDLNLRRPRESPCLAAKSG